MWKSRFHVAFTLNRRVDQHAIDATPARWRGDAGSSPLDRARTEHLTHWLISTQVAIIEDAEKRGELKPGMTVVEATSGNTGIAVAMVCAQRGYDCVICMAEPFSVERRRLMRMLGAKVIVTPKAGKGTGMVRKAEELCAKNGWFLCHQFGSVSKSTTELGLRRVDGVQGLIFFPTGSRTRRTGSSTRPRPAPKSSLISRRRARSSRTG